jgi:drug/metabolite transporter (DMT)-like permease
MFLSNNITAQTRGIIWAALSGILYGSIGFFGIKVIDAGVSVHLMLFWRFLFASIFILPFIPLNNLKNITLKSFSSSFILGSVFYAISTYLFFISSKQIGTGLAMVLFYTYPVFVVLFVWFFDSIKLSKLGQIAIISFIIGITLLIEKKGANFNIIGVGIGALAAIFYGIYFYASKRVATVSDVYVSSLIICLGNSFTFLIISIIKNDFHLLPNLSA